MLSIKSISVKMAVSIRKEIKLRTKFILSTLKRYLKYQGVKNFIFIFTNDTNLIACTEYPRILNNSCKPLKLPLLDTDKERLNYTNSKNRCTDVQLFCVLSVLDTLSFSKPGFLYMCTNILSSLFVPSLWKVISRR